MINSTPFSAARDSARQSRRPVRRSALALAAVLLLSGAAAQAQTAAPAEGAMLRLIRGLMASGTLSQDAGQALLAQAQAEALALRPAAAPAGALRPEPGDVRVPYISQTVREQIRDEVKGQVMAQAKAEGWAAPNETPEWSKRIRVTGDVRVRNESRFYSGNNSDIEVNWNGVNEGAGYDVNRNTNLSLPPLLNTTQDRRNSWRSRARLGVLADISETTQAGIRLASGNDDSPVSTTQTLGGGLKKKDIWLDQAWLSFKPLSWLTLTGGRFSNPFVSTDLLFSNDLNMDGVAARAEHALPGRDLSLFGSLGLIPLEYSSDSAPSRSRAKMASQNKWLLGAQIGATWQANSENRLRGALAYYDFRNISGELSAPCALYAGADGCSSDWSRPATMQKGNSLMLLRDIMRDPLNPANTRQPQLVGLAAEFRPLDLNLRWDSKVAGGKDLRLEANYLRNLAYDADKIWQRSGGAIVNKLGGEGDGRADFKSGGSAYQMQATLGKSETLARGDWNVQLGYKYIQPDALPDGYNDSTFHLGGTNARGYYLGAAYALDKKTSFNARWTSSKEVYGAPFAVDTLQLEFNAAF
ncbi:putative porin [Janthinobacterium sp.]|uniref:putative porin n=1 Tax=Janthinobacterium sp. TaxID=1871054 RepID=UPI00293D2F60|nr:putative porin [Janthinobacterium sp.]